jgi:hypothetical protein
MKPARWKTKNRGKLKLIGEEMLRLRLGTAMRARIEGVFAIDRIAAIYEQAYELIISGRRQQIGQLNPAVFNRDETENITPREA